MEIASALRRRDAAVLLNRRFIAMEKEDLFKSSPVRFFDSISDGGLKAGEMGLITSKKGVGKTSVLVQFGIDALLQDKHLVHISFDQHSSNVIEWYESIFAEIAKKKNLGDVSGLKSELVKNRIILNFNQETFSLAKVANTLKALKEGGTSVQAIVFDRFNIDAASKEDVEAVVKFLQAEKISAWFSQTNDSAELDQNVRKEIQPYFSAVCHMESAQNNVSLKVLLLRGKTDVSATVSLDPKTLLMTNK